MWSNQKLYSLKRTVDGDEVKRHCWGTSSAEVLSRTVNLGYGIATVTKFRPGQETIEPIIAAQTLSLVNGRN